MSKRDPKIYYRLDFDRDASKSEFEYPTRVKTDHVRSSRTLPRIALKGKRTFNDGLTRLRYMRTST